MDSGFIFSFEKRPSGDLDGLSFVLTGTLTDMSRTEAQRLIIAHGGRVTSAVTNKTTYVVVGDTPGSKANKAKELGVTVLNENEFQKIIGRKV